MKAPMLWSISSVALAVLLDSASASYEPASTTTVASYPKFSYPPAPKHPKPSYPPGGYSPPSYPPGNYPPPSYPSGPGDDYGIYPFPDISDDPFASQAGTDKFPEVDIEIDEYTPDGNVTVEDPGDFYKDFSKDFEDFNKNFKSLIPDDFKSYFPDDFDFKSYFPDGFDFGDFPFSDDLKSYFPDIFGDDGYDDGDGSYKPPYFPGGGIYGAPPPYPTTLTTVTVPAPSTGSYGYHYKYPKATETPSYPDPPATQTWW